MEIFIKLVEHVALGWAVMFVLCCFIWVGNEVNPPPRAPWTTCAWVPLLTGITGALCWLIEVIAAGP